MILGRVLVLAKQTEYYGFSSGFRNNILEIEENKRKTEFFDRKSDEHAPQENLQPF
jgi:hypothetical protein